MIFTDIRERRTLFELWIAVALILLCTFSYVCAESTIKLTDVTKETQITFKHTDGSSGQHYIIENVSAGLVLFDFDKFEIKPDAYPVLDKIVSLVKQNPQMKMEIQGHTDNVGSTEYNQKLSEDRAKAIVDYLVRNGIDPEKLSHSGYGLTQPVASNDTEDGRAENRRVELERR